MRFMRAWKQHAITLGAALVAGVVIAALVVVSGVVPATASSGHFAATEWLLNFAKERTVATHSFFVDVAPLDEPWLVMKGAGHYELGCLPCHGGPGHPTPRIAAAMLPPPPPLEDRVRHYDTDELFYIVKHGIKFTGMPAWPAQSRDDEVRAVVAFLDVLPTLDARAYEELVSGQSTPAHDHGAHGAHRARGAHRAPDTPGAHGDGGQSGAPEDEEQSAAPLAELPSTSTVICVRCHGERGEGRGNAAFPKLAGQRADYLFEALVAYRNGKRHSGMMEPIAAGLSDEEMRDMAEHYAQQPLTSTDDGSAAQPPPPQELKRGREIAERGVPASRVPPCAQCHEGERSGSYPLLAGQYADYLELQLDLFRTGSRGGAPFGALMHLPAHGLEKDDARAVARYYADLTPAPSRTP